MVQIEHAEILLQYLSLDCETIGGDKDMQATVKCLPIFEDVDGAYKVCMLRADSQENGRCAVTECVTVRSVK